MTETNNGTATQTTCSCPYCQPVCPHCGRPYGYWPNYPYAPAPYQPYWIGWPPWITYTFGTNSVSQTDTGNISVT
jgi:hypothetical protein